MKNNSIIYTLKCIAKSDKSLFLYFILCSLSSGLIPLFQVEFSRRIVNELSNDSNIKMYVYIVGTFLILMILANYVYEYATKVSEAKIIGVRLLAMDEYYYKCMTTDFQNLEDNTFLDKKESVGRTLMNDTYGIEGMLRSLFQIGIQIVAAVSCIAIISQLSIFIILYIILSLLVIYYINYKVKIYERDQRDEISSKVRKSTYAYDTMSDFAYGKDIRLFSFANFLIDLFKVNKKAELDIRKKIIKKYRICDGIEVCLGVIREAIVYIYLITLAIDSKITLGDFTAYTLAVSQASYWINLIMRTISDIKAQRLYINDMKEFNEAKTSDDWGHLQIPDKINTIEFKDVSFQYPKSKNYALEKVSLTINKDEHIAIVGGNGAGKTTFVKLLCGLYETTEGEILINGVNIKQYDRKKLMKAFSAVFQEVNILPFSIAENISIDKFDDKEKIYEILKKVDLFDKVTLLPHGLETRMQKQLDEDAIELSGGEKQSLAIARAIYKDGQVFILDEPTAALDALKEAKLYQRFHDIVKDKIAIYISHRLSSTQFCDKIVMFDSGKIIEYGTHSELIDQDGKYKEMYTIQAKYYKQDKEAEDEDINERMEG